MVNYQAKKIPFDLQVDRHLHYWENFYTNWQVLETYNRYHAVFCRAFNSYDGGPYHKETSSLICFENQWTGFYMIGASKMKELTELEKLNAQLVTKTWQSNR